MYFSNDMPNHVFLISLLGLKYSAITFYLHVVYSTCQSHSVNLCCAIPAFHILYCPLYFFMPLHSCSLYSLPCQCLIPYSSSELTGKKKVALYFLLPLDIRNISSHVLLPTLPFYPLLQDVYSLLCII